MWFLHECAFHQLLLNFSFPKNAPLFYLCTAYGLLLDKGVKRIIRIATELAENFRALRAIFSVSRTILFPDAMSLLRKIN
jgi:hypothetical protein